MHTRTVVIVLSFGLLSVSSHADENDAFDITPVNFRLHVGDKGALELQKMINDVSDSEGDIFATRSGSLRLILNKGESPWKSGNKQEKLMWVPIDDSNGPADR